MPGAGPPLAGPPTNEPTGVAARLAAVKARIAAAAAAAGRDPAGVTLVAVGKAQPAARIEEALAAGHRVFGENRVQEALAKFPALKAAYPDLVLHLIGPLQTNKVRDALGLFDRIETLDRPKLAHALAKEMARTGRRPPCFIEVNTGEEPQKAGVAPGQAESLIALAREALGLPVEGLMCIPPLDEEPALHFALLGQIAKRNGLKGLSMGMTADFETAIRFGATHVRVGTAIFGPRSTG
ncbi:MAG: YggS family pyridoxal phosphate-dependent enzyme [Kiloniellaceae bacterium]